MADLEIVRLPQTATPTTRLGFGCSNLLGEKTREDGLRLLHAAYESGVRHFDVARVYNFGDAEAIVGEFAEGKRDKITITTKFGKAPRAGVARMRGPVQLARRFMRGSPWLRQVIRRNVSAMTQAAQFEPALAQASLEASLRALKTDVIDIFLLHEGVSADCTDEMLDFLHRLRTAGKIRAFGCGSAYQAVSRIAQTRPEFLEVAQFESDAQNENRDAFEAIRPICNKWIVTHGALASVGTLHRHIAANPGLRMRWRDIAGIDLTDLSALCGFLLRHSLDLNPGSQVLFRASTVERVRATVTALQESPATNTSAIWTEIRSLWSEAPQISSARS